MRYFVLACDYDGTLATHGHVEEPVLRALERLTASGRKLVLVTGRELDSLQEVFPHLHLFDMVVAENGAVLYNPASREETILGEPPSEEFISALRARGVAPFSVGRIIVATWQPHETTVLEVVRDLGLEMEVIFNKGAVMVLPTGMNKGSGLKRALNELGLSARNAVAVGDAENDHSLFSFSECAVAVQNALHVVKDRADMVTTETHGAGVIELIDELIANDLVHVEPNLKRHHILLGHRHDGAAVSVQPYGTKLLVAGPSGSGKSTTALAVLEHLTAAGYQFCLVDPEGDYGRFDGAVILGSSQHAPSVEEILQVMKKPGANVVVNLLGIPLEDRPIFFGRLLPHLHEMRARTGRPHWLVVDEAHHLFPVSSNGHEDSVVDVGADMLITVHPNHVSPAILSKVNLVMAVGKFPHDTIQTFCTALNRDCPSLSSAGQVPGQVLTWFAKSDCDPFSLQVCLPKGERCRHRRKYAEGDVGMEKSFFFHGPDGKLKLRAQNLVIFSQIAEGVDDDTWLFHLRKGDYSRWFQDAIKDDVLATIVADVEQDTDLSAEDSRQAVERAIKERYGPPT